MLDVLSAQAASVDNTVHGPLTFKGGTAIKKTAKKKQQTRLEFF